MGPTAASKALYAIRPRSLLPWDLTIATRLHSFTATDLRFVAHLEMGGGRARALLAESGLDEPHLTAELGRPDSTLAKVVNKYCYVRYTLGGDAS